MLLCLKEGGSLWLLHKIMDTEVRTKTTGGSMLE
jgi:hypothetical protein